MYRADGNSAVREIAGRSRAPISRFAVCSIFLLTLIAHRAACAQSPSDEYKVKAAFIFHFAQLVDWPSGALSTIDPSINLCVFDDEPSLKELQSTLQGKLVKDRVLNVRLLSQPQGAQGCNILFLSGGGDRRQVAILKSLRGQPVLTVGETDSFVADGGMIRLRLQSNKFRFDINGAAADSSQLKISSRLLLLATSVTLGDQAKGGH